MATPNGAVNSIVAHRAQRRVPHNALDAQLQVTADVMRHSVENAVRVLPPNNGFRESWFGRPPNLIGQ